MGVVLIGYRGSGKSTVGRALATRMGWRGVDLDEVVVGRARKDIRAVFAEEGETGFRDREAAALRESVLDRDIVLSAGGGVLEREENHAILKNSGHRIVYLRCEPGELWRRIEADAATAATRPALTALGGGLAEVTKMLARREPGYRAMAHYEVDVTRLTASDAAERVAELLRNE